MAETFQSAGVITYYTVSATGTFELTADGAEGGAATTNSEAGGKGAEVTGDFTLTKGDVIEVIVGGGGNTESADGGGGGGTFIIDTTTGTLLEAAGGGGGAGYYIGGSNASTGTSGTASVLSPEGNSPGGTPGGSGQGGGGANYEDSYGAGGGAGYLSNGDNGAAGSGGMDPAHGAAGGVANSGAGGFGGGGGGDNGGGGGGGGGGYSGGGGAGYFSGGGGGGSYINPDATDTSIVIGQTTNATIAGNGFAEIACFAAGTHIATPSGPKAAETLQEGDVVETLTHGSQRVRWLGRRRIDLAAHPRPETVAPVRIREGAFADNIPHSDLLVSPDHGIFVDGMLICARQLINGTTIVLEKQWTAVEYFHVELDAHAVLLSEGLPTESYLDTGNRGFFANGGEPLTLHPDLTDEKDYPARETASCAPFVWDEVLVQPVWERLAERAAEQGQPVPSLETTTDPELSIRVKGRLVRPMYNENGLLIFALPRGATQVHIVSRAASPTDARPWMEDRRRLGVYVQRIVVRGTNDELHDIPLDHRGLTQGWWDVERSGVTLLRWTDGDAVLPLPVAQDSMAMLELQISGAMTYVTGVIDNSQAAQAA